MAHILVSDPKEYPAMMFEDPVVGIERLVLSPAWPGIQMEGVVGYYDHTSVPGHNDLGAVVHDEEIFASDTVTCIGAPCDVIPPSGRCVLSGHE